MQNPLRRWLNRQSQSFRERRLPRGDQQRFDHKNLFIMPTRFGMSLLLCCTLLFILGTNYQNNPILLFSYLLLAWFLLSLYYCFVNLSKCQIQLMNFPDCFSGDQYQIQLMLSPSSVRHQWQFWLDEQLLTDSQVIKQGDKVSLSMSADHRGWHYVPEITLRTIFPSGLFQCWSYLRFESKHWVYPKPQHGDWQWQNDGLGLSSNEHELPQQPQGASFEDVNFEGIRPFQAGESMTRVSWKHQAKVAGDELLSKDFSSPPQQALTLSLESVFVTELEQKLAVLTQAILTLEQSQQKYGLRLNGYGQPPVKIPPAVGQQHMQLCLQQLASFNQTLRPAER